MRVLVRAQCGRAREGARTRRRTLRTDTTGEYFYDYAAQDPIDAFDLTGTMLAADNGRGNPAPTVVKEASGQLVFGLYVVLGGPDDPVVGGGYYFSEITWTKTGFTSHTELPVYLPW